VVTLHSNIPRTPSDRPRRESWRRSAEGSRATWCSIRSPQGVDAQEVATRHALRGDEARAEGHAVRLPVVTAGRARLCKHVQSPPCPSRPGRRGRGDGVTITVAGTSSVGRSSSEKGAVPDQLERERKRETARRHATGSYERPKKGPSSPQEAFIPPDGLERPDVPTDASEPHKPLLTRLVMVTKRNPDSAAGGDAEGRGRPRRQHHDRSRLPGHRMGRQGHRVAV
jgi:hypothetical protein